MRRIGTLLVCLLLCLTAPSASAGRVFGDIKMDGKPIAPGLPVVIDLVPPASAPGDTAKPAPVRADSTVTDKFGSYKLAVKAEGKCILSLLYEKQLLTLEVFSYKEATRYDLILEKKDGKLSLRRK